MKKVRTDNLLSYCTVVSIYLLTKAGKEEKVPWGLIKCLAFFKEKQRMASNLQLHIPFHLIRSLLGQYFSQANHSVSFHSVAFSSGRKTHRIN